MIFEVLILVPPQPLNDPTLAWPSRTWALGDTTFLEAFQRTGRVTWYVLSRLNGGKNGHDSVKGPWLFR